MINFRDGLWSRLPEVNVDGLRTSSRTLVFVGLLIQMKCTELLKLKEMVTVEWLLLRTVLR